MARQPPVTTRLDAVCVGETMAMVAPQRAEPLEMATTMLICPGGAESNVAMYLADLGHRVAWLSRLGDDPLGRRVLKDIAATGVDTSLVEFDPTAPTGVYFKDPGPDQTRVFYYRKGSAASLMDAQIVATALCERPRVVHLTGITPALSADCRAMTSALFTAARAEGTKVSFDVNFRPGLWTSTAAASPLLELARLADVVFVGTDEAAALWGLDDLDGLRQLLPRPVVVVKDGRNGATVLHAGGRQFVPSLKVAVCERIGAGDAFAAGWLSGLLRDLPHGQRLKLGHIAAGRALSSTADYLALPCNEWIAAALELDDTAWSGLTLSSQEDWVILPVAVRSAR